MSVRRAEFAQLEAAGWIVTVDSPWRRAADRLRALARAVFHPAGWPA